MLDVVLWISEAWTNLNPLTLVKSWRKLLDHKASDKWFGDLPENTERDAAESKKKEEDSDMVHMLKQIPGCEEIDEIGMNEWMVATDEQQELTDNDILDMVSKSTEEDRGEDEDVVETCTTDTMSHSDAVKAIE